MIELCSCTSTLLGLVTDPAITRDDVSTVYAMAIASTEKTDWRAVNEAIMARWSKSALLYIKRKAWKELE